MLNVLLRLVLVTTSCYVIVLYISSSSYMLNVILLLVLVTSSRYVTSLYINFKLIYA